MLPQWQFDVMFCSPLMWVCSTCVQDLLCSMVIRLFFDVWQLLEDMDYWEMQALRCLAGDFSTD
jgi:hypothetical protein